MVAMQYYAPWWAGQRLRPVMPAGVYAMLTPRGQYLCRDIVVSEEEEAGEEGSSSASVEGESTDWLEGMGNIENHTITPERLGELRVQFGPSFQSY